MYNAGKVITGGVIVFLCLAMFPVWYVLASGKYGYAPELEVISEEKQCVESSEWMRFHHPDLLVKWGNLATREGIRTYVNSRGEEYKISLTSTCMDCHSNKSEFCDRCHDYAGVEPNCWNCHVAPEEK